MGRMSSILDHDQRIFAATCSGGWQIELHHRLIHQGRCSENRFGLLDGSFFGLAIGFSLGTFGPHTVLVSGIGESFMAGLIFLIALLSILLVLWLFYPRQEKAGVLADMYTVESGQKPAGAGPQITGIPAAGGRVTS